MNENITQQKLEECNRKMREMFQKAEIETLQKMPMWMRFNYLGNKLARAVKDGVSNNDIDWDKLNHLLSDGRDEYDFNCYDYITTPEQFFEAREWCIESSILNLAWQKHICKDCGNKFTMNFSEVEFFRNKELHLPKRCPKCRAKRKEVK